MQFFYYGIINELFNFIISPTPTIPQSLPDPVHDLVGRQSEMGELTSLLHPSSTYRIISITGGPGFGKSMLAISIGHKVDIDVIYINFQETVDMYKMAEKILSTDAVRGKVTMQDLYQWSRNLKHETLIILDNCDEQFHTSKDDLQSIVTKLVRQSKYIKVLTTSRQQVAYIDGHKVYHIEELSISDGCKLLNSITTSLARDQCIEIAGLTGGVPLALHVVGALLGKPYSPDPQQIIDQLNEQLIGTLSPEELRTEDTVNASIWLSYRYLEDKIQKAGRYLSYFPGLFSIDAACQILGNVLPGDNPQNTLDLLISRSLLNIDNSVQQSYFYHKLIREFFKSMSNIEESNEFNLNYIKYYAGFLDKLSRMDFTKAELLFNIDSHNLKYFINLLTYIYEVNSVKISKQTATVLMKAAEIISNFPANHILDFKFPSRNYLKVIISFVKQNARNSTTIPMKTFLQVYLKMVLHLMRIERIYTKNKNEFIATIKSYLWFFPDKHSRNVPTSLYIRYYSTLAKYYEEIDSPNMATKCHERLLRKKKALNECSENCSNLQLAKAFASLKDNKRSIFYCDKEFELIFASSSSQNIEQLIQTMVTLTEMYYIYNHNNIEDRMIMIVNRLAKTADKVIVLIQPKKIIDHAHSFINAIDILQMWNVRPEFINLKINFKNSIQAILPHKNCVLCMKRIFQLLTELVRESKYLMVTFLGDIALEVVKQNFEYHEFFPLLLHMMGDAAYLSENYAASYNYYRDLVELPGSIDYNKALACSRLMKMLSPKCIPLVFHLVWYNMQTVYSGQYSFVSWSPAVSMSTILVDDFLSKEVETMQATSALVTREDVTKQKSNSKFKSTAFSNTDHLYDLLAFLMKILLILILICSPICCVILCLYPAILYLTMKPQFGGINSLLPHVLFLILLYLAFIYKKLKVTFFLLLLNFILTCLYIVLAYSLFVPLQHL